MTAATVLPARRKLDVGAYHALAEAGVLGEDERVELIGGDIIDMAPIGEDHCSTVDWLAQALFLACRGRAIVRVQGTVRLDRHNEVQPDFSILRPRGDFYRKAHPGPADALLLVEVAKTSLRFDRSVKLPLYARFGIAEYWIVDLTRGVLTVHRRPAGDGYDAVDTRALAGQVALALAPEIVVDLSGYPGQ